MILYIHTQNKQNRHEHFSTLFKTCPTRIMQQNEECQTSILRESILYTQSQTDDLYQQLQEAVSAEKSYRKAEQKPSAK